MTVSTVHQRVKRPTMIVAGVAALSLLLAGCSSTSDEQDGTATDTAGASSEAYPVTIDTEYGEITVDEKPERIIAVGANYVDILSSIDEQPIAFAAGTAQNESEVLADYPWLEGIPLPTLDTNLFTTDWNASPETIATWEPDLIIGEKWNVDDSIYAQLSQIAPTYVSPGGYNWETALTALGTATGKAAEAEQVIADMDAEIAAARERLSGLQGRSYQAGAYYGEDRGFVLASGILVDRLGLEAADDQPVSTEGGTVQVAPENTQLLDADVLFITPINAPRDFEENPLFRALPAVDNDTVVVNDQRRGGAIATSGPASWSWLLPQIVNDLEDSALNQAGL